MEQEGVEDYLSDSFRSLGRPLLISLLYAVYSKLYSHFRKYPTSLSESCQKEFQVEMIIYLININVQIEFY